MKNLILTSVFACVTLLSNAQQKTKTEEFTKINAPSNFKLQLIQDDECGVKFEEADLDGKIVIEVSGKALSFVIKKYTGDFPIVVKVFVKNLEQLDATGNAIVSMGTDSALKSEALNIKMDGAVSVKLNVVTQNIYANVSGASKLNLRGESKSAIFEISGASKLNAASLKTEKTTVQADGACEAKVLASNEINIKASGVAKVTYGGNPATKNFDKSGLAKVRQAGDDDDGDEGKAYRFSLKKSTPSPKMKNVYGGFEFGMNTFITPDFNFKQTNKVFDFLNINMAESWFFSFNLGDLDYELVKSKLSIATGLGFEWIDYSFNNKNYVLKPAAATLTYDTSANKLTLNRLSMFNMNVPVLLKWNSKPDQYKNRWHIATGIIFGYSFLPEIETETSANGYQEEVSKSDDFYLNRLRATATLRFGYDFISVFANYGLTPMFDTNVAPDTRNFQAGIGFNF